jgi:hypothetical protein
MWYMNRIEEIYQITKKELQSGYDIYDYISILYGLKKEEDYEAMEGIKRAIGDFGILLNVPEDDNELDKWVNEV